MQYNFCPTFISCVRPLLKKFKNNKNHIRSEIYSSMKCQIGDKYPGFGTSAVRKARIGLPKYRLSKRNGLRFIYLSVLRKEKSVPIHIYQKGKYKKEHVIKDTVKNNLKGILKEIQQDLCKNKLPDDFFNICPHTQELNIILINNFGAVHSDSEFQRELKIPCTVFHLQPIQNLPPR